MKIKLDENPASATDVVAAAGFDVDTVTEERLSGDDDGDVVAAATAADRLLIALDRGLGDVRRYRPAATPASPCFACRTSQPRQSAACFKR